METNSLITQIDAELLADSFDDEFRVAFEAADETTQRAVVGYLNTYAGPWGLKASEEDALLGIILALWPEWATDAAEGIRKMRTDARFDTIADDLMETAAAPDLPIVAVVARAVTQLNALGLFDIAPRPAVGTRVRFARTVERYPHDSVESGETGTISYCDNDLIEVTLDARHPGFDEWDNAVQWFDDLLSDFADDTEAI